MSLNNHLKPLQTEKSGFILRKSVPFLWQDTDIQWPIRLIIGRPFRGSELLCGTPSPGKLWWLEHPFWAHIANPSFRGCCFSTGNSCLRASATRAFPGWVLMMTPQRPLAGMGWQGIFPNRKHMVRVFNITCRRVFCGRISPCDCISLFPITSQLLVV